MKAQLTNLTFDRTGEQILTLRTSEDITGIFDDLNQTDVEVSIKKWRKRRSVNANSYAWVLMNQLSERTGLPVRDVYRRAIKEVGDNSDTVCVLNEAVPKLRESWEKNGQGWCTEIADSKLNGCTNVVLYYGSSTYDTAQMSRLIDVIVEDCKAVGIETKTPEEIASLIERWGE